MRRVVTFNHVTADGYFAGIEGSLDWMVQDDEYQLVVNPVVLGSGRPLFRDIAHRVKPRLLEAKPYESGDVMLRYAGRD